MAISVVWIDNQFPGAIGLYTKSSDPSGIYNCVAFAASDDTEWWSHFPGYKWPARRSPLIDALVEVFLSLGFQKFGATETMSEPGYDKVALYELNGFWKHAARQLPNGKWTSKLGPDEDIEHDTPECLGGNFYGTIHCIMRKART
jgi:hypothetical protein